MNFPKIKANLVKVYDELAQLWGKETNSWGEREIREFARLVNKNNGSTVLDCGCGSGVQTKQLCDLGFTVTGLDLSPKMITEAKKTVPKAEFIVGDMAKMSFKKESFNGIYARASLLHIPKKLTPKVLRSICRILRKNGVLYLALKEGQGEKVVEDVRYGKKVHRFFAFFTKEEIESILKKMRLSSNFN